MKVSRITPNAPSRATKGAFRDLQTEAKLTQRSSRPDEGAKQNMPAAASPYAQHTNGENSGLSKVWYERAVRVFGGDIHRRLLWLTHGRVEDAEDLLSRCYEIAWAKRAEFNDPVFENVKRWLLTIAWLEFMAYLRRQRRIIRLEEAFQREYEHTLESASVDFLVEGPALRDCLSRLSSGDHRLVDLYYGRNLTGKDLELPPMTTPEIATLLSAESGECRSDDWVRQRLHIARALLGQCMREKERCARVKSVPLFAGPRAFSARHVYAALSQFLAKCQAWMRRSSAVNGTEANRGPDSNTGHRSGLNTLTPTRLREELELLRLLESPDDASLDKALEQIERDGPRRHLLHELVALETALLEPAWQHAANVANHHRVDLGPDLQSRLLSIPARQEQVVAEAVDAWTQADGNEGGDAPLTPALEARLLSISRSEPAKEVSAQENGNGQRCASRLRPGSSSLRLLNPCQDAVSEETTVGVGRQRNRQSPWLRAAAAVFLVLTGGLVISRLRPLQPALEVPGEIDRCSASKDVSIPFYLEVRPSGQQTTSEASLERLSADRWRARVPRDRDVLLHIKPGNDVRAGTTWQAETVVRSRKKNGVRSEVTGGRFMLQGTSLDADLSLPRWISLEGAVRFGVVEGDSIEFEVVREKEHVWLEVEVLPRNRMRDQ